MHRAADREPGVAQAQGRADRLARRAHARGGGAAVKAVRFGPDASAAEIRALSPAPPDVESDVRAIVDEVRSGGDAAVRRLTERFDHAEVAPESLLVPLHEIEAALSTLEPDV